MELLFLLFDTLWNKFSAVELPIDQFHMDFSLANEFSLTFSALVLSSKNFLSLFLKNLHSLELVSEVPGRNDTGIASSKRSLLLAEDFVEILFFLLKSSTDLLDLIFNIKLFGVESGFVWKLK
jgi:hypothetical protein